MKRILPKHPLAIRWLHWIGFPLLALMIWSGLMIYWANGVYRIGLGDTTIIHFFPDWFYNFLALPQRLAEGMALHFFFMWFFALNGVVYVAFLAISGEWRYLAPERRSLRDAVLVTLHDLHLRKDCPPQGRYNGAQRIAYTGVILMGAGSLITGAAIYKPVQLGWITASLGGYEWARLEHFWLMIGFVSFFAIHVVQVVKAGWNNFRSMVVGYEVSAAEDAHDSQ
jgi:thiosulfate reductase cytochrome b subunit